jgi:hypothetical protein
LEHAFILRPCIVQLQTLSLLFRWLAKEQYSWATANCGRIHVSFKGA